MIRRRSIWDRLLDDPRASWRPLPWQLRFLQSTHPRRLLRAGNQLGKTEVGCEDLICHATGVNPWGPPATEHPIEAWVLCASWSQSVAVQRKLWRKLPKHLLHPGVKFDEVNGFSPTKQPAIRILHRSGDWSVIRVKTVKQGGLNLSSATIQYAWFDEPPPSHIWDEVVKRLQQAGSTGRLIVTMTPVNADVGYLQELAERGSVEDHHQRLEPDALIPMRRDPLVGWVPGVEPLLLADGTPCNAAWVARTIEETTPFMREVRCHGEWAGVPEDAVFGGFRVSGPRSHVSTDVPRTEIDLYLGIDHGVRRYTQVAILVGVDHAGTVWILDEYVGDAETTDDNDADGILSALERQGLSWAQLDEVYGDRAHYGSGRGLTVAAKSNQRLARALLRQPINRRQQHRIVNELVPPIKRAKHGVSARPGSVEYGCAWLHRRMVADRFRVHPRCTHTIAALLGYRAVPNSDESHLVDALRYALRTPIWRQESTQGRTLLRTSTR